MEDSALIDRERIQRFLKNEARHWGVACRAKRTTLGLTLEQVAALAGTSPQTVFKVERGQIIARDSLRYGLAFALSCEVEDIFPMPTRKAVLNGAAA